MKLAIIPALALLATPAYAQAPQAYLDAIEVCRVAFAVKLSSQPVNVQELLAKVPPDRRELTIIVCSAYDQGQLDLMQAARDRAKAKAL